jgi:hypothetical protein
VRHPAKNALRVKKRGLCGVLPPGVTLMNDLVQRLMTEQHVEASLRPEATVEAFKAAMDRGYVHIRFTGTRGQTELGVRLDREKTDVSMADFTQGAGTVKIVGTLTLDYVPVVFHGTIDLATLAGSGRLEPVQ